MLFRSQASKQSSHRSPGWQSKPVLQSPSVSEMAVFTTTRFPSHTMIAAAGAEIPAYVLIVEINNRATAKITNMLNTLMYLIFVPPFCWVFNYLYNNTTKYS